MFYCTFSNNFLSYRYIYYRFVSTQTRSFKINTSNKASLIETLWRKKLYGFIRYSPFSRDSSVDVGNESRHSVTSISSYSTSSRRYEIVGQRSIDSRASITSLWSSDASRRDSEAIPEHEMESSDSRASYASAGSLVSSDGRRYSDNLGKRRRSSARSSQIRRNTRRVPLSYDRRRTTGRFVCFSVLLNCSTYEIVTFLIIYIYNII